MATTEELACVYSSLILQDDNRPVTSEQIQALLQAANANVEPYWPGIFSKALTSINLKDLISNVGAGGGSSAGVPQLAADAAAVAGQSAGDSKKEDKKEEEEEEEDDDMGFGLFD